MTQSKKVGGRRFSGYGLKKWDPKPGTVEWYKANMPERLNNTAINISNGMGIPMDDYQSEDGKWNTGALNMAARVIRWSEQPLAQMVGAGALDLPDKCPSCGTFTNHKAAEAPKKAGR